MFICRAYLEDWNVVYNSDKLVKINTTIEIKH